jgi:hypothetical protein
VPGRLSADEKKGLLPRATSFSVTPSLVHRSPHRARWALFVVLLLVMGLIAPTTSHAQEPDPPTSDPAPGDPTADTTDSTEPAPDQPPPPAPLDPSPHVRVLMAQFAITDAQNNVALEQLGLGEAQAKAADAAAVVAQRQQQLADDEAALDAAKQDLQAFSVGLFIHADGGMTTDTEIDQIGVFEQRKAKQLTDSILDHKVEEVAQAKSRIADATQAVDQAQQLAGAANDLVTQHESTVDDANQALRDNQQELRDAQRVDLLVPFVRDPDDEGELDDPDTERANDTRSAAGPAGPQHQWELTIEGASLFTPEELAAWFDHFQVRPTLAKASAADLARFFVDEGGVEGIRGDVAFAQAILETGSFTNDDTVNYNNFAGIGHCDSCPSGWNFASPQDGVRAQIQLLKSYVYEKPEYKNDLVDKRLHGPAGCCQTWNELSGVWASGGGYGALIMNIYENMLEWLYQQRMGAPPPPRPGPSG